MMRRHAVLNALTVLIVLVASGLHTPYKVLAHCDGLDGPVVTAAQNALDTGNVNRVLIWVQKQDEAAGQAYVQAYVAFIHYVERLYKAAKGPAHGHFPEVAAGGAYE